MFEKSDLVDGAGIPLVYVRAVNIEEMPEKMRPSMEGEKVVYAIHDANGKHLAFVKNRTTAFALARTNDMSPVSVH